jgi:hypothetical protein
VGFAAARSGCVFSGMAVPGSPSKMVNESSDFTTSPRTNEGGFLEFFLTPTDKRNLSEWLKPVRRASGGALAPLRL